MAKPSGRRTSQFKLSQGQPQPSVPSLENNFVGGLKTEYTGLNFPENACTATNNCTFTRIGNVTRRNGFDFESYFQYYPNVDRTTSAISTFIWKNAGGDGSTEIYVLQVGATLYFYNITNSTTQAPLSSQELSSTVILTNFKPSASTGDTHSHECQYASGNGYLFVFHPYADPFYCYYSSGNVFATAIAIQQRDFTGTPEPGVPDTLRPVGAAYTNAHKYNIQNQGWTSSPPWSAYSTDNQSLATNGSVIGIPIGSPLSITGVASGITGISAGQVVNITMHITVPDSYLRAYGLNSGTITGVGTVSSYSSTTLVVAITSASNMPWPGESWPFMAVTQTTTVTPANPGGQIATFQTAASAYPSNSDVWWQFKNSSGVFSPSTTLSNVTLGSGPAPKGYYILNSFIQQRTAASGVSSITDIVTYKRPKTGAWFQGRVFYAGVDDGQVTAGNSNSWSENIYFSQIVEKVEQFGRCYQTNDPTDENLFDILPTDGGVIVIQGSGSIYKLFPVLNGLLVFAAEGIWFITGSSGLGFTATDYTVSKLSGEHAISGTSFVDVAGYPIFWNSDGIYSVMPGQSYTSGQRSLEVKNLTLPTIKQFYQNIPISSKKAARGSYNHITGVVEWLYKSTEATSNLDAYNFDSILNFLTYTEAFYTWSLPTTGSSFIHGIDYIEGPGGSGVPPPLFKYVTSFNNNITFSEEKDNTHWVDFYSSGSPVQYTSSFTTGYKLKGQAQRRFQPQYIWVYSEVPTSAYTINGVWDFAASNLSNRFSTIQVVNTNKPLYSKAIRRHRIRGNGYSLQYEFGSVAGHPFNISGWSVLDTIGTQ